MTDSVPNTEEQEPTGESPEEPTDAMAADPDIETDEDLAAAEATLKELDELALGVEGAMDAEVAALREEVEALNDRHLRLAAEFNNYRRRVESERTELWARAQSDLVAKFLDVLDDLQRLAGLDLSNATVEAIMEGIDLVDRKFMRVLADAGVEVLDPVGEAFSPETMDAMMRVPAESEEEDDTVDQVFQKGYALKGNLIRPARVSVYTKG